MQKSERIENAERRYRNLGGLASVIERYERGEFTLRSIGDAVGASRETVRNDIKRLVGSRSYGEAMERRRAASRTRQDVRMSLPEAVKYFSEANTAESRVLADTLDEMRKAGVPLTVTLTRVGALVYTLADGRCVKIRVAVVKGNRTEHKIGFHRFKMTNAISPCPFMVFALRVGDETMQFVFKTSEISGVRSLNLRFTSESKYEITRKSKYDKSRGNWAILKA